MTDSTGPARAGGIPNNPDALKAERFQTRTHARRCSAVGMNFPSYKVPRPMTARTGRARAHIGRKCRPWKLKSRSIRVPSTSRDRRFRPYFTGWRMRHPPQFVRYQWLEGMIGVRPPFYSPFKTRLGTIWGNRGRCWGPWSRLGSLIWNREDRRKTKGQICPFCGLILSWRMGGK